MTEPASPREFASQLHDVAHLDAPEFVDTLVASLYEYNIHAARTRAADNR